MTKVSIVGAAGTVGAAAGYNLALRDVADELVFVDIPDKEDETVGQAADTNHGVAYDSNTTVRQGDYSETAGSDVVVITAGIPRSPGQTRIDLAGDNAPIMDDIGSSLAEHNDDFVTVTTSNPVDLLNRHLYETGDRDRRSVVGFGGRLDSARFRYVLSERFDTEVQNVEATILGEHGDAQVPVFSKVRVDGRDPAFDDEREEILGDLQESAMDVIERKGATQWGPRRASPTRSRPSCGTRARCCPARSSSTASTATTTPRSASPANSARTASRKSSTGTSTSTSAS
jgi:malate dehydrogenase